MFRLFIRSYTEMFCDPMTPECTTCGRPTPFAGRCPWCWDVETAIDEYLKSSNGREFIREKLKACENSIDDEDWIEEADREYNEAVHGPY